MSSIYKKGRDGYYYYQTYVYNAESRKKDKRIFQALGTKDIEEAKTKQRSLDLQHEKLSHINPKSFSSSIKSNIKPTIIIIVATSLITIFVSNLFRTNTPKKNASISILQKKNQESETEIDIVSHNLKPTKPIIDNQIITAEKEKNQNSKVMDLGPIIPKYVVERVERLSSAFDQGKIFVTINKNSSNESRYLLCENIKNQYSEFSNIIICLYANNRPGIDLARGNDEKVSIEEQKRFWLSMYTYNSVEGEYFDDNPSGYLGIY